MIDASKLPTVPSEVSRAEGKAGERAEPIQYARAPDATGPQQSGTRPLAKQSNQR
jgi:hypothetical protein